MPAYAPGPEHSTNTLCLRNISVKKPITVVRNNTKLPILLHASLQYQLMRSNDDIDIFQSTDGN